MKKNFYYKFKNPTQVLFAFALGLMFLFSSCKKDELNKKADFQLKDNPTNLLVPAEGISETYTVISNGSWIVEPLTNVNWVTIDPLEGTGNGTFTVNVRRNNTMDDRSLILTFMADGKRPNISLKIEQEGLDEDDIEDIPYLIIDGETSINAPKEGTTQQFNVQSNGNWKIELEEDGSNTGSWVNIEPAQGNGDGAFSVTVAENTLQEPRTINLAFFLNGKKQDNVLQINQEKAPDPSEVGKIVFSEDFSWLNYGSPVFYTTGGETYINSWSAEETAKGWTSTVNPAENKQPIVFARPGFVKLGKTNYGGDLISPKLSEINGTKTVEVKFKAIPYQTQAGTRDGTSLKINIIGPGTISTNEFNITNWPNYDLDPDCTEAWKDPEAERTFIITGATSETQIRFLGGDFDLRQASPNKNRIFLDDIVVSIKE